MRRVMLHEQLPEDERYAMSHSSITRLRRAMSHARRYHIPELVEQTFADAPVEVFHKPGFAARWVSDILYIERTDTGERWLLGVAAQPDRSALNDAVPRIAALLSSGRLRDAPHRPGR
jgi:hypothetical protein